MKSKFYTRIAMVFATMLMFSYSAFSQTTFTVHVADDNDDCEEYITTTDAEAYPGFMDEGSSDLELTTESDDEPHYVGMIFRNVTIPAGATIENAYVEFTVDESEDCIPNLTIFGALIDNMPAPFTNVDFEISSKPRTTATVAWTAGPWTIEGEKKQTPNLQTIIQEIIGVSGWASGNNMLIVLTDPSTVKCHQCVESHEGAMDHADETFAPLLSVTYSEGGTAVNSIRPEFSDLAYPNPTRGVLNINNPSTGKFSFEINSINGKLVASRHNISGPTAIVDMSGFAKGMYFIDVRSPERSGTLKIIVK